MVGIEPIVMVSGVDEEGEEYQKLSPSELVVALAIVKAHTVAQEILNSRNSDAAGDEKNSDLIIIGSDSTFEFEGISLGKPGTRENAIERCRLVAGESGILHTGHCIIALRGDSSSSNASFREYSDIASTRVHFASMSDDEISAYVDSGEPLHVAGGFTLDGLSAPFIRAIEGDWSNVIGLSLPLIKEAISSFGYQWFEIATAGNLHEMGSK
jgi:septum formation protein